jgi:hypothetical protein
MAPTTLFPWSRGCATEVHRHTNALDFERVFVLAAVRSARVFEETYRARLIGDPGNQAETDLRIWAKMRAGRVDY